MRVLPGVVVMCLARFTFRQKQVLLLLLLGHSEKQVGYHLGIHVRTVKRHIEEMGKRAGTGYSYRKLILWVWKELQCD